MAVVKFDLARYKRLSARLRGFTARLAAASNVPAYIIYRMVLNPDYGCTPKGQRNIAAANKAMGRFS